VNAGEKRLTAVEQHLGDRLAALVDGELGHDARERVLSHLATCWNCKAEADAQRRLKSVFADTAPPPPSAGLMARLQGLPAGSETAPPPAGRAGGGGLPTPGEMRAPADGFGGGRSPLLFAPLPGGSGPSVLAPAHGVRSHRDHDLERSASRGRRFAFAAAGAFSMAALALSGTVGGSALGGSTVTATERSGSSAGQVRPAATAAASDRDTRRRASAGAERTGRGATAPLPSSPALRKQQAPVTLAAASHHTSPLAGHSVFTPSFMRPLLPPRVLPEATQATPALPGRTPSASAAPPPALPMAGARP
jgi:hypothetical protein